VEFARLVERGLVATALFRNDVEDDRFLEGFQVLEGLDEMFTINRLGLPKALRRCLGSTNVIESPNSGIRSRTRRVKHWRDHAMVVRWVAASLLDMETRFKKIMGYQQLWILDAKLKDLAAEDAVDHTTKVA